MSELILFICIFSITCGYMKIGNLIQNKKLINYGLLTLFIWFTMFIWVPFAINFFGSTSFTLTKCKITDIQKKVLSNISDNK